MDPNWFYSSLAQCAAAVVGLLGAVVATRLQQQYADAKASHRAALEKVRLLEQATRGRRAAVERYLEFAKDRVEQITNALTEGQAVTNVTKYHAQEAEIAVSVERDLWGDRETSGLCRMRVTPDVRANYQRRQSAGEIILAALEKSLSASEASHLPRQFRIFSELQTLLRSSHPEVDLEPLRVLTGRVVEAQIAYDKHLLVASVRVPATLAGILAWLCATGLLVPLAFLTSRDGGSKGWLLLFFAVGTLSIPGFVAFELVRIWRLRDVSTRII